MAVAQQQREEMAFCFCCFVVVGRPDKLGAENQAPNIRRKHRATRRVARRTARKGRPSHEAIELRSERIMKKPNYEAIVKL